MTNIPSLISTKPGKLSTTILIVDDSETDRATYCRYLNSDLTNSYHILEAETIKEALSLWQCQDFDVVLLDLNLPDGDGWELLDAMGKDHGETKTKLPVIMLTEVGDEGIAVQSMKKGAMDYLVKKDITSIALSQSIYSLLDIIQQAERYENLQTFNARLEQKVEERTRELIAKEHKFQAIFDNTFQFTGLLTTEGILVEANQTALSFGGIQLEDVINRPFWETYWWTISQTTQDKLKQAIASAAQGEFIRYEVDVLGAGGQIATIDFSLRPLKNELGQVLMLIAEGRDITEKKHLEGQRKQAAEALQSSEAELRGLFNAMVDVILVLDQQGRYLKIAPTKTDNFYRPSEEVLGKTVHQVLPTHLADMYVSIIQKTLATQQTSDCEYKLQINNRIVWFNAKVSPISPETVIWVARDISEAKRNEIIHQQALQALQENQILLRMVMDSLPIAIFWKDRNSNYLGCNKQLILDAGLCSIEEIIGKTDFDMPWREQAPLYQAGDRMVIESGQPQFNMEEPFTKTGNVHRWLSTNKIPLLSPKQEIIGVLCSYEDITEQKKIARELKASEQRYATLAASAPVGIYRADAAGNCLYVNNQWCENTGLTPQAAAAGGWKKSLHPEDRDIVEAQWDHFVQTGETFSLEYRFVRPDGVETWVFGQAVPEQDSEGMVTGYVGTITNITERKVTEQERDRLLQLLETQNQTLEAQVSQRIAELQKSQERFRNLVETSSDWIWEVNESGIYTYVSPQIMNILGYSPAEVLGKSPFEFMPPAEAERVLKEFSKFASVQAPFQCLENTNCHKDGKLISLETSAVPIFDQDRQFRGYRGIDRDITARKQTEVDLHENEARFQRIAANLPGVMYQYLLHPDGYSEFVYISDHSQELYELEPASIIGDANTLFKLVHREDISSMYESIAHSAHTLEEWSWEGRVITPSGRLKWIEGISQPQKQANGAILWDGLILDISERKQIEIALRDSEEFNRSIFENNADCLKVLDLDGNIISINQGGQVLMEIDDLSLVIGEQWVQFWRETDQLAAIQAIEAAKIGKISRFQGFCPTAKGIPKWWDVLVAPVPDLAGNIIRLIATSRDITANKEADKQLRNLSDRLNLAIKSGQIGIWDWDIVNDHLVWDDRMYELYGVNPSDFPGAYQAWEAGLHPDDVLPARTAIEQAIAGETDFEPEYRIVWPDGTIKFIKAYAIVQRDQLGKAQRMIGINFDITERKQSEAKLQAAEIQLRNLSDRLKLAVKSAKIGIWDLDLINDSLVWDERMYQIFGVSSISFDPSETGREKFEQLVYADDRVTIRETIQQVIADHQELDTEFRIVLPNGTIRIIKANALVEYNSQGQAQRMIGINYDITNRRREELENQRLKERLEFVLSASPAIIYTCEASGNYRTTFIGKNVQNILGYTVKAWLTEPNFWVNHIHPDDLPQVFAHLSHLEAQEDYLHQYRFLHQDGNYRWLEDEFRLVRDKMGVITEIIGYIVDISEQQAALRERELVEAEILRSRDLREAIFNESADALFLVDIETVKTLDCNQRAVEMFAAMDKHDLIGIEGHNLQKQQFTPEELTAINNDMESQGVWSRELEYKTFKDQLFWGNLAAKQITVAGQKMNLVRVTDISQRKMAETQLQETNKQLAASNQELARATRLKDEFLANMSHELRTPLNAILGISEGLQDEVFGVINERQRQGLQTIERSGTHLLALINDILDLSKIEAGQVELEYSQIAISQLCQSSLSFIKQQAFQKQIQLDVKIQANLPDLLIDERRIRQVLINLLNNAVKFTLEGGSITLTVTGEKYSPGSKITHLQDFIRIAVTDTGIGIAPENLHKLFQPFVQIDSSLNRKYNGTGLGLSLVKRIVEMHGGKVDVRSEIGVGSCFIVDLPYANMPASSSESINQVQPDLVSIPDEIAQKSPLILLAEDNEGNVLTISSYLEAKGYRMIWAKTGQEAIELAKSHFPDLILMDIQMPEMDGLEAMKQIRLNPDLLTLPIIALTALAMPGDQEKCLAAGANHYLSKPLRLKELTTIIQQLLD
ncbi:PAS domain S-box protein [Anabaena sp. UHCC 0187]|uniref:PAS domain S-box protein n=1 Tax=Anabaena sp. UHCC 0187 TaxID=2590018 RepID=UPI001444FC27|nr:PAS domain S-box protein [Anabaena sp. UHCC 0187]MTJ11885.1 PAS domain S-box protein [Anabaena sp. UHCC 0187]